jgi:hypothetical protein
VIGPGHAGFPGPGDVHRACLIHTARVGHTGVRLETNRGDALFRGRRQERREEREATRYQMRQRMISIGDDYVIENDRGERVFKLDGKALRIR